MHLSMETWNEHATRTRAGITLPHRWSLLAIAGLLAAAFVVTSALRPVAALTESAPGQLPVQASSQAVAVRVTRPSGRIDQAASVTAGSAAGVRQRRSEASFLLPADGSIIRATGLRAEARTGERSAGAQVAVGSVSLLGGRIVARQVGLDGQAGISGGTARSQASASSTLVVTVDGEPVGTSPNSRTIVPGVGTLTINEQAIVGAAPAGDDATGPRHRTSSSILRLRLTQRAAGLPAGSEVLVAGIDVGVRQQRAGGSDAPTSTDGDAPTSAGAPADAAGKPFGGRRVIPGVAHPSEGIPRQPAPVRANAPRPRGNLDGYVFPVLGEASYSNDFFGARSTGMHRATDIFAPIGTPIVAIADGVLDRVGWNSLGGHRLWLHDAWGNSFYYAHLSAFAPVARDGAFVRAGEVIGFVGDTGNAKGTPPHLHFEIHDSKGQVRNPYFFLNAWIRGVPVSADGAGMLRAIPAGAPLGSSDISSVSGLADDPLAGVETPEDPVAAQLDGSVLL